MGWHDTIGLLTYGRNTLPDSPRVTRKTAATTIQHLRNVYQAARLARERCCSTDRTVYVHLAKAELILKTMIEAEESAAPVLSRNLPFET